MHGERERVCINNGQQTAWINSNYLEELICILKESDWSGLVDTLSGFEPSIVFSGWNVVYVLENTPGMKVGPGSRNQTLAMTHSRPMETNPEYMRPAEF